MIYDDSLHVFICDVYIFFVFISIHLFFEFISTYSYIEIGWLFVSEKKRANIAITMCILHYINTLHMYLKYIMNTLSIVDYCAHINICVMSNEIRTEIMEYYRLVC